jgi:hypothetical protein
MIFKIYGYFEKCISLVFLSPEFKKCMVQAAKKTIGSYLESDMIRSRYGKFQIKA